jgi:membrane protease YdiL (CAAX protease family)
MINTPVKHLEERMSTIHPGLQFLIFAGVFLIILFVGNLIGAGIVMALYGLKTLMAITSMNTTTPHFLAALWILQITGTTLPILGAAVFFATVIVREPRGYLKTTFKFSWILLILVFAIMFCSNPIIEYLSNLNQKMVLPPFLKWMRNSEDSAEKLTKVMLQMNTIWDMLADLMIIGLLTAIVEEFMFRGVIQTILFRWTKSVHAAVWITAILFSAFHIEFFGFLPRMMLGVLFGYFVAWSGSIWTAVWAHFINNGSAVVVTYLFQHKIIKTSPDDEHVFTNASYLFSLAIVLFLLYLYQKKSFEKSQTPEIDGEELG